MKTIALRFADNFAPKEGTIALHKAQIAENGFVWYGKLGNPVSKRVGDMILKQDEPRILLIHSGGVKRYWVYVEDITHEQPDLRFVPDYYGENCHKMRTWFKVYRIEDADKDVMSKCIVVSSKSLLSHASRYSMSPYFVIEYKD